MMGMTISLIAPAVIVMLTVTVPPSAPPHVHRRIGHAAAEKHVEYLHSRHIALKIVYGMVKKSCNSAIITRTSLVA